MAKRAVIKCFCCFPCELRSPVSCDKDQKDGHGFFFCGQNSTLLLLSSFVVLPKPDSSGNAGALFASICRRPGALSGLAAGGSPKLLGNIPNAKGCKKKRFKITEKVAKTDIKVAGIDTKT